jgi:chromosome segregation protein
VREQEQAIGAEATEVCVLRWPRRVTAARAPPRTPRRMRNAGSRVCPRAAADRREGLARLHGQVNALKSRARRPPTTRSADSARRSEEARRAPSEPNATSPRWRPRSPVWTPAKRGWTPSTRPPSALLDDFGGAAGQGCETRPLQADRDRASLAARKRRRWRWASTARTGRARCSPPPTRSPGCWARSPPCSTVRPGYEAAVASPRLGQAADAVVVRDSDAAVDAIGHLKSDDLGRAGLLLGGLGRRRTPRATGRPAGRGDVRRRGRPCAPRPGRRADRLAVQGRRGRRPGGGRGRWSPRCPTSRP